MKSKSPTRTISGNQLPAEAYGKRTTGDFNLGRRRDASHNRLLNQPNSNYDLINKPPNGKLSAAPTPVNNKD